MVVALLVAALIADIALSIIVHILFKEVEELREHEQNINLELVDLASKNRDISIIQNTLKDNDDTCHKLYVKMKNEVDDLEKRLTASHKYFEIKYSGILGNVNDLWTHMDATEKVVLSLSEKTSNTDISEHKMKEALKTAINSVYGLTSAKKVALSLSEKTSNTSNTNASEHKIKEPHYRHRHFYTYNSKPVSPIPDITDGKEEVNENDSNAGSKEEQNTENSAVFTGFDYGDGEYTGYGLVVGTNAGSKEEQNTENDAATIEQIKDDDIPTFNDPSSIQK